MGLCVHEGVGLVVASRIIVSPSAERCQPVSKCKCHSWTWHDGESSLGDGRRLRYMYR